MKKTECFIYPLLIIWVFSIIWVNFHCSIWYQMDAYCSAYLGRLISINKTFFPPEWIFSNQYYIIGTPSLSALFYRITHDSVKAMSYASSLNTLLILLSFYWCFLGSISKKSMAVGLLCISGGIVFGTSAVRYISGLQVLYTLSSYYACYLIVLLLTIGCWLRMKTGRIDWPMISLTIIFHFTLGMHSLRSLLVIVIPLLLLEFLLLFSNNSLTSAPNHSRSLNTLYYATAVFLADLGGIALIHSLNIPTTPNIDPLQLDLSLSGMLVHFWSSLKNVMRVSGLAIASDGIKYLPLSFCALFIAILIIWVIIHIFHTKDFSPLAQLVVFSLISVFGVFFVGVFLMRTRDIYYFVYWFLACVSIIYTIDRIRIETQLPLICCLTVISLINYCYNFIPDIIDYHKNAKTIEAFTQTLIERGVQVIYSDATPIFAATSHDKIRSQSFWLDVECNSGYPLSVFPSDKDITLFDNENYKDALICFSDYSLSFLNSTSHQEYRETLFSKLELVTELRLDRSSFFLYKPINGERILSPCPSLLKP